MAGHIPHELKLKFIGCGDAFGSGGQLNTCFYLHSHATKILVDCGATSLPALRQQQVPIDELDAIIITHFHGDHYGGVPLVLLYLATYGQKKQLKVISPAGGGERIRQLLDLMYPGSAVLDKLEITFLEFKQDAITEFSGIRLEPFEVRHTPESLPHGIRLSIAGKTICFSGDTGWHDNLVHLAAGADVFICECCFFDTEMGNHLSYRTLVEKQHLLKCKRIILNHFDTEMLANLDQVELEYVRDGEEIHI